MAHHAPRVFNEINITPLTDIFLVLLIIMMVVAPMLDYPGIKLAVPSMGPDETTTQEPKTMTVRIAANGTAELVQDGQAEAITPMLLPNRLRDLKVTAPDGLVIQVDPTASHEALTRVMDAGQQAGLDKIAVTRLEVAPPSSATMADDVNAPLAVPQ